MILLEIACFNLDSVVLACKAGADRVELCQDRASGGITPLETVVAAAVQVAKRSATPIFIMIRPRGGDFCYTEDEHTMMIASIQQYKDIVDGVVFGVLDSDHKVDVPRTRELVEAAYPLPSTFHRAFDESPDKYVALDDVCLTGCKSILTSAGAPTALEGSAMLADLVYRAGTRIEVIAGGGVRSSNIDKLSAKTNARTVHSAAIVGDSQVADRDEILEMKRILACRQ